MTLTHIVYPIVRINQIQTMNGPSIANKREEKKTLMKQRKEGKIKDNWLRLPIKRESDQISGAVVTKLSQARATCSISLKWSQKGTYLMIAKVRARWRAKAILSVMMATRMMIHAVRMHTTTTMVWVHSGGNRRKVQKKTNKSNRRARELILQTAKVNMGKIKTTKMCSDFQMLSVQTVKKNSKT